MELHADGSVRWSAMRVLGGTDMGMTYSGVGRARYDGEWLHVRVDPGTVTGADGHKIPAELGPELDLRLHPAGSASGRMFLLSERDLVGLVNTANSSNPRVPLNSDCYRHRTDTLAPGGPNPLFVPVEQMLPALYLRRLLALPLAGRVVAVTGVSQHEVNTAGWMRPAVFKTQYTGRLSVDFGVSAGVFPGMRLYVGKPVAYEIEVQAVAPDRAEGLAKWVAPTRAPTRNMPVSSAAVYSSRQ